jgi:hypothetical protein
MLSDRSELLASPDQNDIMAVLCQTRANDSTHCTCTIDNKSHKASIRLSRTIVDL